MKLTIIVEKNDNALWNETSNPTKFEYKVELTELRKNKYLPPTILIFKVLIFEFTFYY